jgi:hypothetical protein
LSSGSSPSSDKNRPETHWSNECTIINGIICCTESTIPCHYWSAPHLAERNLRMPLVPSGSLAVKLISASNQQAVPRVLRSEPNLIKRPQALRAAACPGKLFVSAITILPGPGKLKAAATLPSRGVLIAVPVSGTFRILQGGDSIRRAGSRYVTALAH